MSDPSPSPYTLSGRPVANLDALSAEDLLYVVLVSATGLDRSRRLTLGVLRDWLQANGLGGGSGGGDPGHDGREIELRATETHLQWRYVQEPPLAWENLLALEDLQAASLAAAAQAQATADAAAEMAAGAAPANHSHEVTDVTGLGDALAGKAAATHSHAISQVSGLAEALAAAQGAADAAQNTADSAEMSAHTAQTNADDAYTLAQSHAQRTDNPHGVTAEQVGAAPAGHGHAISEVSGLTEVLAGKAAASHGHAVGEVDGLSEALAGKVADDDPRLADARDPTAHSHAVSEVFGLDEELQAIAGKADADHTHDLAELRSDAQPEGKIPEADGDGGVRWVDKPSGGGGDGAHDLYSTNRQVVFGFAGSGTSGTGALVDGAPDHPSGFASARIWQLGTGTAADGRVNLSVGSNGANGVNRTKVRPGEFAAIEFVVRGCIPNLSDETNTFRVFFGVIRSISGSTPDYAGAVLLGNQLTVGAQSAATESTGAAFTIAANVPFHLRVRVVPAASVQLWVNGTSIGTVSTNVLTDGATLQQWLIGAVIAKSNGSTSRNLFVADAITLTTAA